MPAAPFNPASPAASLSQSRYGTQPSNANDIELTMPPYARYELARGYAAAVTFMDSQLGRVLDGLDASGAARDTVIVFFSDHGFSLGDNGMWGKRSLMEPDAR